MRSGGTYDVAVIGGGHNGLVAAGYLARADLKVLLLEREPELGGLCRSVDPFVTPMGNGPVSLAAAWSGMLQPSVRADLSVEIPAALMDPQQFYVAANGDVHHHPLSPTERLRFYSSRYGPRGATIVREMCAFEANVIRASHGLRAVCHERTVAARTARLEEMDPADREFLAASMRDVLGAHAILPDVDRAAIAQAAMSVQNGPATTPGGGFYFAYMALANTAGLAGAWGLPKSGMGVVASRLAERVVTLGADVRTGECVEAVTQCDHGFAILHSGTRSLAKRVLFTCGLNQIHAMLDAEPLVEIAPNVANGVSAAVYIELDALPVVAPEFSEWLDRRRLRTCVISHGPSSLEEISDACVQVRDRGAQRSTPLLLSASFLGTRDNPVMYVYSQFVGGVAAGSLAEIVVAQLEQIFPGLGGRVRRTAASTPETLASLFHVPRGHPEHLQMHYPSLLTDRPTQRMAEYRLPTAGLYHGSAGAFPGGLVTGLPGRNSALSLIDDLMAA